MMLQNDTTKVLCIYKLEGKINSITHYQRACIRKMLERMAQRNSENVDILCNYIIAEQNELNIKESTKEGKVKCLAGMSHRLKDKPFHDISKQDILDYLTSLKKPISIDPNHKSIGTYNGRQMILLKFFKWLYNPDEPDARKRTTPPCMNGVKRLPRQEKSPYKPADLWTQEEHEIFLKYCPSVRDKAFHAMAYDTSARPHELLSLKIGDIVFKKTDEVQYAEILVTGKTKPRTLPLISSLPYVKEWIQMHPHGSNSTSWLFISYSRQNILGQITRDGLLKRYGQYYRKRFFPKLVDEPTVSERDKAFIRNMFTKPWNLYIFRHTALTHKSRFLKENILRDHAGWSATSKMPQVYIHYFGTESSNSILEAYGILGKGTERVNSANLRQCPNCNECNKPDSRFCFKCKVILKYDAYIVEKTTPSEVQRLESKYATDMRYMREEITKEIKEEFRLTIRNLKSEILREGLS